MGYTSFLLIDDDPDDHEIFKIALDEVSFNGKYEAYGDAEYALKQLRFNAKCFDVIFLDLNMPKIDGFQFLEMIKEDAFLDNIPIYMYSTCCDPTVREKAIKLGAYDFVTKFPTMKQLISFLSPLV